MLEKPNGQVIHPFDPLRPYQNILIKNGRVLDPAQGIDRIGDVAIANGTIEGIYDPGSGFHPDLTIDARGCWVVPGLMDMHVHLREPGREDRETIDTGTRAAAAGGFTAVACMPNTSPVLDEESKIKYVTQRAQRCPSRIYPIGAITKNLDGEELAPFDEMIRAGAKAFSDDGKSVRRSSMMRNAFNYSKSFNVPIICHCEDADLAHGGHMNESAVSTRLGIKGIPSISEEIVVARDIMLAEYTAARVHIAHISTAGSVQIIREAKERGVKVTCETCPHYLVLTDNDLCTYDPHFKMNPPLRTELDREALIRGLVDGTIDVIASDHAPHVREDKKDVEFEAAAFGVIGLETSLAVVLNSLVHTNILDPATVVEKMSCAPHRILGVQGGTLKPGTPADVTVINPDPKWTVQSAHFYSKARNTPFEGMCLRGYAQMTIMDGRVVYERSAPEA